MTLSGKDLGRLQDAFLGAYDADSLQQLLLFKLDQRWNNIVASNTSFSTAVFQLLNRAGQEGWLRELIEVAMEDRSRNATFVALGRELLSQDTENLEERDHPTNHNTVANASAGGGMISSAELRQHMTERLNRSEIGILWFDLFGTTLDSDLPGHSQSDCVIELLARARQRGKMDTLITKLDQEYPHVL